MASEPKLLLIKNGGVLHPRGDESAAFLERLPSNRTLLANVWQSRNAEQLALYWSVCAAAARFGDLWDDKDSADWWVRRKLQMYDTIKVMPDGTVIVRPRSIAGANMTQPEFNFFFERAMAALAEAMGVDPIQLLKESTEDVS